MQLPTIKHIRPTCWSASALSCHTFPLISSRGVSRISGLRVCRVRSCPARRACTVPVRGSALSHRNLHHADRCPPWATRALGGRRARSLPSSLAANTWGGGVQQHTNWPLLWQAGLATEAASNAYLLATGRGGNDDLNAHARFAVRFIWRVCLLRAWLTGRSAVARAKSMPCPSNLKKDGTCWDRHDAKYAMSG